jgi:carboxymethylenebutenolidase
MGHFETIEAPQGDFKAYIATPAKPNGAALVVIQEIFGVNQVMRDLTDQYAEQGYIAICPDLFWRIEPGIDITDKTPEEWSQAFDLFGKFNPDTGIEDIQSTIKHVRSYVQKEGATGKVGAVGYCLGGLLAYLTATRTDIDASVSYYGVGIADRLGEAANIKLPLLMHVASKDKFVPPDQQAVIQGALATNNLVSIHTYEGLDHAFARQGGEHWDEAGASLANQRTSAHFAAALL